VDDAAPVGGHRGQRQASAAHHRVATVASSLSLRAGAERVAAACAISGRRQARSPSERSRDPRSQHEDEPAITGPIAAPTASCRFAEGSGEGINDPALPPAHPMRGGVRSR
jgi:hypothetical protein